jgi:plastocyanin
MGTHVRWSVRSGQVIGIAGMACITLSACSKDSVEPEPSYPATVDVFTPGSVFSPPTAEIRVGGVVRFIITQAPDGDGHNANFIRSVPGAPPDVPVLKDTTVSRQFDTRGTFSYVCTVHPGMTGEVIVH